ncbi:unnamed protein product, partial [Staurois parvus]
FTISGLPQYTEHGTAIILVNTSKYKLLNTFFHLSVSSRTLVKACRRSFLSALGRCRTPDLCLDSADWPCGDHMHSPRKKKSLDIHTKLSMCRVSPHNVSYQEIRGDIGRREGSEKSGSNSIFKQCRGITP